MTSVVIPSYNRPKALSECLRSLDVQEATLDYEVVVIDDGSQFPLTDSIDTLEYSFPLRIFRQENQGPGAARNYGVHMAEGDIVLFTDDDCQPGKHWVQSMAEAVKPQVMIGGLTKNAVDSNPYSMASQCLIDALYTYFEGTRLFFITSNNMACRKDDFLELGGFDASLFETSAGEDREFTTRWIYKGWEVMHNRNACIDHYHAQTLTSFYRMHAKYGRAAVAYWTSVKGLENQMCNDVKKALVTSKWPFQIYVMPFPWRHTIYKKLGFGTKLRLSVLLVLSQVFNVIGYYSKKLSLTKASISTFL